MIIKYFTKVSVRLDPFLASAKNVRLFLARIPLTQNGGCPIDFKVTTGNEPPNVLVTFKDKKTVEADPSTMSFNDLRAFFDGHLKKLATQELISE